MIDYRAEVRKAIADDIRKAVEIAHAAFNDTSINEDTLANIAGMIFDISAKDGVELVIEFVNRFPNSLHLMRVICADICNNNIKYDQAIYHARLYLRLAKEAGILDKKDIHIVLKHGIARAFSALADGYAGIGAFSYAIRVLKYSLNFVTEEELEQVIRNAITEYEQKLQLVEISKFNMQWESFFKSGDGAAELIQYCSDKNMPEMAKRIELIDGNFRFNRNHTVDDSEILQVVNTIADDKKESGYLLA